MSRLNMLAGLEKRLLTGIVLVIIVIAVTLYGSSGLFYLLMSIFTGLAAWEWLVLSRVSSHILMILFPACVLAIVILFYLLHTPDWYVYAIFGGVITWCLAFFLIVNYQAGRKLVPEHTFTRLLVGVVILVAAWINIYILYNTDSGIQKVLLLFVLVWCVDTSAYFIGTYLGRHRLASQISPGKTWEGFLGSMTAAILLALLYAGFTGIYRVSNLLWLVMLFMAATVFSVIGDLFISIFKRSVHLKDTSSLLPGHGGVLDRIDSLVSATPIFVCGFWLLGDQL